MICPGSGRRASVRGRARSARRSASARRRSSRSRPCRASGGPWQSGSKPPSPTDQAATSRRRPSDGAVESLIASPPMRRTTPIIIVVLAAFFLIVDFWPKLTIPNFGDPNGGTRVVDTKLGLDLVGGLEVVYSLQPAGGKEPDAGALATTKTIIENRVNSTGVAEPIVQSEGTDRIQIVR